MVSPPFFQKIKRYLSTSLLNTKSPKNESNLKEMRKIYRAFSLKKSEGQLTQLVYLTHGVMCSLAVHHLFVLGPACPRARPTLL